MNDNIEIWKKIYNLDNYEISNYGNIKNSKFNKLLKINIRTSGYATIVLHKKSYFIHRLVAEHFLKNNEGKPTVNHKDHNRVNNNVNNLEFYTQQEQNNHRRKCIINNKILCKKNKPINDNEIWKEIPPEIINNVMGYFISQNGIIKSSIGKIFYGYKHDMGYLIVSIKNKTYLIHRLVMLTFNPNNIENIIVNHIDGDKTNCKLSNLEWCSYKENTIHCHKNNLINKYTRKIYQYDKELTLIKSYNSIIEASKELYIYSSNISKCCNNKIKSCNNFIFKYQ